jgi:hypothetical protein
VSSEPRRGWIDWQHAALSITRQCALVGVPRSTVYYEPVAVSTADLELTRRLDAQYTRTPFYGSRRMTAWLRTQGYVVNRKRVTRLLALLGLAALVVRRRLSTPAPGHRIYRKRVTKYISPSQPPMTQNAIGGKDQWGDWDRRRRHGRGRCVACWHGGTAAG